MKKDNAYFTVEAALVLPAVLGMMLFVIYMLLFQYNRCLMEQDLGAMAMWGSSVGAPDTGSLEEKTRQRMAGLYREKYAAWKFTALDAVLEKNSFSAAGTGQLLFPVPGMNFWSAENIWETSARYSFQRLSPVTFIRLCRRVQDVMGGEETEEEGNVVHESGKETEPAGLTADEMIE